MRKLYALVLCMVALTTFGSERASAYAMSDYIVRVDNEPWYEVDGTNIPELLTGGIYNYYYVSKEITIPFNWRMNNYVSNKCKVNGCGSIMLGGDAQWDPAMIYDYYAYSGYYMYQYSAMLYPQYGYGYAANYRIDPFVGGYTLAMANTSYTYTTEGSAPNRRFIVQTKNRTTYYSGGPVGHWQAILSESGISNALFKYNQVSAGAYNWNSLGSIYYAPAIGLRESGYYYEGRMVTINPRTTLYYALNYSTAYNKPVYEGADLRGYYSNYNIYDAGTSTQYLPTQNWRVFIAYDYDPAASANILPANEQIILKDVAVTPQSRIANEGKSAPTSVTYRRVIWRMGDPSAAYTQDVTLTGSQVPASFTSTTLNFPSFTPTLYGIYFDSVYVVTSTPADQLTTNNVAYSSFTVSPPNNIKAIMVTNPAPNTRTPINIQTPPQARFKNIGANNQINVPVTMVIRDPGNNVIYRDTVWIPSLLSGQTKDTTFRDWVPTLNGPHLATAIAILGNDQLREDDTTRANVLVRYETDIAAVSVFNPQPDEEKPFTKTFRPFGIFQSVGVADLFDIPARVQIRRCADNQLVFQADSIIPELNVDQNEVKFGFPTKQGNYDITKINPGCYNMCVIARYPTDGERTNDTACTTFTIIDRLKGDIFVGVGQRFQTISAAVDSMRFRGVGGHLRLILTDASYTENGNTTVSSARGAVDMTGIQGTADTARVTWMPKAGVSPTITFTGNRASCFYFGNFGPSYMTFDGMNQLSPTAEKMRADASKRGMTIRNNSNGAAGTIFTIENGFSNFITLKNMKLVNNGMFTNDSSAVIRVTNVRDQFTFAEGVRDTMAAHDIRIENNEMGNARYGVLDMGIRSHFSLGEAKFKDRRTYNNIINRNSIGSATNPIGYAGVMFGNHDNLTVQRNDVSYVNGTLGGSSSVFGIAQRPTAGAIEGGNVTGTWIDGNRVNNLWGTDVYGVAFQQSATIYTNGVGANQTSSTLPAVTKNRTTNNMIYDLRGTGAVRPIYYATYSSKYFTDRDSVFNNSISVRNARENIRMSQSNRAFMWNNSIQNANQSGTGVANYYLEVPRPMLSALSSDFNLFDLGNNQTFAIVREYDRTSGQFIQQRTFRRLNDWRTYTAQDGHSIQGNPMYAADSLHMPSILSAIASPSSNNGMWLNSAAQRADFDGETRLTGNLTPDIGADEFEGYQLANDLAVLAIYRPGGYSTTSDTTFVVQENPMMITAAVKNLGYLAITNKTVTAKVEVAINGGAWTQIWSQTMSNLRFDVNETRMFDFTGPVLTEQQATQGVFRVTVSVAADQNNQNNQLEKVFRTLIKKQALLVSYESSTAQGLANRDSVVRALTRMGVPHDVLDRNAYGSADLDYTPWWTVVWSTGNPSQTLNSGNSNLGVGAVSFKETEELERYLDAGQTYGKKSLIIAGQNVGLYANSNVNGNTVTDFQFLNQYLRTRYIGNTPVSGGYNGTLKGEGVYFKFTEQLTSTSPDVLARAQITSPVGDNVNGLAYWYTSHPATPADSAAGITWHGSTNNVVFFAFDWSDPKQTTPGEAGINTSGVTRVLRGALDFVTSFKGTVLPVDFTAISARYTGEANEIAWTVANQKDVARFEVEALENDQWTVRGTTGANTYSFVDRSVAANQSYTYRVVAVDLDGSRTASKTVTVSTTGVETGYALEQNYPNPFNPSTQIGFTVPENAVVSLNVLDVTGKTIATVLSEKAYSAGTYTVQFDANGLTSGTYVYELSATNGAGEVTVLSRKMALKK